MEAQPDTPTSDAEDLVQFVEDFDDDDENEFDDDDYEDDFEEEEGEEDNTESLVRRLSAEERVVIRVNDVIIKGNTRTYYSLVAAEVEPILREARSFRQLLLAASAANARLQELGLFDKVTITLKAGPPGTVDVVVDVSEPKNWLTGDFGIYCQPEGRSNSVEGSFNLKNLFGFGDLWDGSLAYGWGQVPEVSMELSLPKFKGFPAPLSARISLRTQDWLKFSSRKEQVLGLSLGLLSTGNHDVSYNLSWRSLTDPSQSSSETLTRQPGHSLISALKYAFKIDRRDSAMRPTRGHAFLSTTQIGGLFPDSQSLRHIRQEFDLRCAIPFGIYRAAFNFGISGGVIFPWGSGILSTPSYVPERSFLGDNSYPLCSLRGPTSTLGFKARGLGPVEPRRLVRDNSSDVKSDISEADHNGGELGLTAFADFSFDLPLRVLQEAGVHGHIFACTGSLNTLSENAYKEFSFQKFRDSFRSWAGLGLIIPTKLFRMEVNYCHILKRGEHDRAKTGLQFSFSRMQ